MARGNVLFYHRMFVLRHVGPQQRINEAINSDRVSAAQENINDTCVQNLSRIYILLI